MHCTLKAQSSKNRTCIYSTLYTNYPHVKLHVFYIQYKLYPHLHCSLNCTMPALRTTYMYLPCTQTELSTCTVYTVSCIIHLFLCTMKVLSACKITLYTYSHVKFTTITLYTARSVSVYSVHVLF